jgi:hypothetical protein
VTLRGAIETIGSLVRSPVYCLSDATRKALEFAIKALHFQDRLSEMVDRESIALSREADGYYATNGIESVGPCRTLRDAIDDLFIEMQ